MLVSQALINQCLADSSLVLSPLSLQEMVFTLAKLKVSQTTIVDSFNVFKVFVNHDISVQLINSAFQLALSSNMFLNFNDAIHARFAEQQASKLITFDRGFRKFEHHISVQIEVLT